ncbi:hypothetical protein BW737_005065 [Actinomyces ruminis]|uniref:Uncharacterized protein n=1 Tax=Actinomyces ruminis TaxID=1937003 RepID=A0ABX4MC70_9ACTO|nr:hypothetical protein BW737_005065 [Actinomyces ruminis]
MQPIPGFLPSYPPNDGPAILRTIDSHPDVDTIDADEVALGLGRVSGGLTAARVHRLIADLGEAADVVGLTVAEYVPRELLALGAVLAGLPLVTD